MAQGFQCPACGADFEVQESLEEQESQGQQPHQHEVKCPNCGNEFEPGQGTQDKEKHEHQA